MVAAAGCSSDVEPVASAEALVGRYVKALAGADFAGAMSLRCATSHVDAADKVQFLDEIDRLEQRLGVPLAVASVSEVDGRIALVGGSMPDHEFRFTLRTENGETEPMRVATVAEDGEQQLCAFASEASFD